MAPAAISGSAAMRSLSSKPSPNDLNALGPHVVVAARPHLIQQTLTNPEGDVKSPGRKVDMVRNALLLVAVTTILPASALAGTPAPITPGAASQAVTRADLPRPHGTAYLALGTKQAACTGVGTPKAGRYMVFRCSVTGTAGQFTAWARITGTGLCASSISPLVCSTPTAPKDPRLCGWVGRFDACLDARAVLAARRHVGGPSGLYQGVSTCLPSGVFVFACQLSDATGSNEYTVTFTRSANGWSSSVSP